MAIYFVLKRQAISLGYHEIAITQPLPLVDILKLQMPYFETSVHYQKA